jgi:hypothetical protein
MNCKKCKSEAKLTPSSSGPNHLRCGFCGQIYDAAMVPIDMRTVKMRCGLPPPIQVKATA